MFKQILSGVKSQIESTPLQSKENILGHLLIAKYGSHDKATEVINDLKLRYPNDDDFSNAIAKELHLDTLMKVCKPWGNIDSLQKVIRFKHQAECGEIYPDISGQEATAFRSFYEAVMPVFPSIIQQMMPNAESLFVDEISNKVRFSIKEIRDEIGLSQRTFTKWLNRFFETKYDGYRYVTLTEYIEIYEQLMLKEDEDKFNFVFDNEKYLKRINEGLVFSKEKLAELTESDYKTLQANCENFIEEYKHWDLYPYRIAIKILEKMD